MFWKLGIMFGFWLAGGPPKVAALTLGFMFCALVPAFSSLMTRICSLFSRLALVFLFSCCILAVLWVGMLAAFELIHSLLLVDLFSLGAGVAVCASRLRLARVYYFFSSLSSILFYNLVIYFCYLSYYFLPITV